MAIPYLASGHQVAHDRLVPYMRTIALRDALKESQFPPRWFPDFDGGYGSPYPSFYAMAFYYPAAILVSAGVSVGAAVEMTAFLSLALSGIAMFLFLARYWGASAGVLGGVMYLYAPYHLADAFERGAYSELAAFVWFPIIALSLTASYETGKWRWVLLGGLSLTGLILTHNLMTLIFLPGLPLLLIGFALSRRHTPGQMRHRIVRPLLAGMLGLALAAYFWLPILIERAFVRLEYFLQFDYRGDFVPIRGILGLSSGADIHIEVGRLSLGLAVSAVGIAFAIRCDWKKKGFLLTTLLLACFNLFMTTRFSDGIWMRTPYIQFVQFPWRFLAPASFYLAATAGPLAALINPAWRGWAIALTFGLVIAMLYLPLAEIPHREQVRSLGSGEICAEVWGTQDYRPTWSEAPFWNGLEPPANPGGLPALPACISQPRFLNVGEVEMADVRSRGTGLYIAYQSRSDTAVILPQFYYPGWEAMIDGRYTDVRPTWPDGLIYLLLPEGKHQVELVFQETPARSLGNLVTAGSLVIAIALLAVEFRRSARHHRDVLSVPEAPFSDE